jgi:hypothetical protein
MAILRNLLPRSRGCSSVRRNLCRAALVAVVALGATTQPAAAADPVASDVGIDDQINEGIALRRAGKDEAALGVFLDLEKRAPDSVRLLLHITTAALATGKWTLANDYMQKASARKDDAYYQRHRAAIENVERVIAQHVGQFRANGSPPGAEVRLSGAVIGTLPMGNAKAIEVGSYMLEVSKPGFFSLRRPVTIASDGSLTQEDIELREQRPFAASLALGQSPAPGDGTADTGAMPPPVWWRSRLVTWSLFGVGVAAGAASGVAFAVRENDASRWNSTQCLSTVNTSLNRENVCPGTRHDIDVAQNTGIGTGVAAGVFLVAALVHGLSTQQHSSDSAEHAALEGTCAPGLGSLVCSGSF